MEKNTFEEYVKIIGRLRAPDGCPWDRRQTHESLKSCLIDESAEVMGAIDVLAETGYSENLCEELGDLLLQVVLQSRIAEEEGLFTIEDVIRSASEKMLRRHPHVFGPEKGQALPDWEAIKEKERECVPESIQRAKERALSKAWEDIRVHLSRVDSHLIGGE